MEKKMLIIFLALGFFFISCSKKESKEIVRKNEINENIEVVKENVTAKVPEYVYVNSKEGLRVRKNADIDSEKIGSLVNKEKVELISKDMKLVDIDGMQSYWYQIKAENGVQGYAFGAYLEPSLEKVEDMQSLEGEYWDEKYKYNVRIENIGNGNLSVTTNMGLFCYDKQEEKKIMSADLVFKGFYLFSSGIERDSYSSNFYIKFNENKELYFQDDIIEVMYESEDDEIGTKYTRHKKILFNKGSINPEALVSEESIQSIVNQEEITIILTVRSLEDSYICTVLYTPQSEFPEIIFEGFEIEIVSSSYNEDEKTISINLVQKSSEAEKMNPNDSAYMFCSSLKLDKTFVLENIKDRGRKFSTLTLEVKTDSLVVQ